MRSYRIGAIVIAGILACFLTCLLCLEARAEKAPATEKKLKLCYTRTTEGTNLKGVGSKKLWRNGSTITVAFMDGDEAIKSRVAEVASEWTKYANLRFAFDTVPAAQADVRVSFDYQGYWSFMGPGRRNPSNPTVNLEGLGSEPDDEVTRVTLHEFGHVLGLYHEHQNPAANIRWNRDAVYEYFETKQGWPRKLVDQEYLQPVNMNLIAYATSFDSASVMCYRILPEFNSAGLLVDYNIALSPTDKAVIAKLYPR